METVANDTKTTGILHAITARYRDPHLVTEEHLLPIFFLPVCMLLCPDFFIASEWLKYSSF